MATLTLYVDTDHALSVSGLQGSGGDYVNNATVQATVYESDGTTEVSGQSWPVTLDYQAGTDGNYSGVIDNAANLVDGAYYQVVVTATHNGLVRTWRNLARAQYGEF